MCIICSFPRWLALLLCTVLAFQHPVTFRTTTHFAMLLNGLCQAHLLPSTGVALQYCSQSSLRHFKIMIGHLYFLHLDLVGYGTVRKTTILYSRLLSLPADDLFHIPTVPVGLG